MTSHGNLILSVIIYSCARVHSITTDLTYRVRMDVPNGSFAARCDTQFNCLVSTNIKKKQGIIDFLRNRRKIAINVASS